MEKPSKYVFTCRSFFFNGRTGYFLKREGNKTVLNFDTLAENPGVMEKIWWFFVKPIHGILANKVLRVVKKKVEKMDG